ncbi:MAG: hypothetical protein MI922_16520 [Bacteroidales bacterium]|nr:hypothetical protein [Bacteroidales bacterium]
MKILEIKHIEDCFDGTYIKELLFSSLITKDFILSISQNGKLTYFENFERPFFKIVYRSDFYIKGVEGNQTARILLHHEHDITYLKNVIKAYETSNLSNLYSDT